MHRSTESRLVTQLLHKVERLKTELAAANATSAPPATPTMQRSQGADDHEKESPSGESWERTQQTRMDDFFNAQQQMWEHTKSCPQQKVGWTGQVRFPKWSQSRDECADFGGNVQKLIGTRKRYHQTEVMPEEMRLVLESASNTDLIWDNGIVTMKGHSLGIPTYETFALDLKAVDDFSRAKSPHEISMARFKLLEKNFEIYCLLNGDHEEQAQLDAESDFNTAMAVDNHIHLAACMTATDLRNFIASKLDSEPDRLFRGQKLSSLMAQNGISAGKSLTLSRLCTCGSLTHSFNRFDNFVDSYCPIGDDTLRALFLKNDAQIEGQEPGLYFGELVQMVFERIHNSDKNQAMEPRITISGRNLSDWNNLANWAHRFGLLKHNKIKWSIQLTRLYHVWFAKGCVQNFEEYLRNIFAPLFEATCNPSGHSKLSAFLEHVGSFDQVHDESIADEMLLDVPSSISKENLRLFGHRKPVDVTQPNCEDGSPPYSYYMYFYYANIHALNMLRRVKGLNTFDFRPHAGEAGETHHLCSAFLLANSIAHGVRLEKVPALQYLYYLEGIGLATTPLSNNALVLSFAESPILKFFKRGLLLSINTDDPLQFHSSASPLVEEYHSAAMAWRLTECDKCELAMNSVLNSSFDLKWKCQHLGVSQEAMKQCRDLRTLETEIDKTHVPALRSIYRRTALKKEIEWTSVSACAMKGCLHYVRADMPTNKGHAFCSGHQPHPLASLFGQGVRQTVYGELFPMWLLDASKLFQERASFPRFDSQVYNKQSARFVPGLKILYEDIVNRSDSFVIFVSHRWLSPSKDGTGHPDRAGNPKFKMLQSAVNELRKKTCNMTILLWVDYCCLEQTGGVETARGVDSLPSYIERCDALLTPVVEENPEQRWWTEEGGWRPFTDNKFNLFNQYASPAWIVYKNRAWCRVEFFVNGNAQEHYDCNDYFHLNGSTSHRNDRVHLLYGQREMERGGQPWVLPPLLLSYFKQFKPTEGELTYESDRDTISKLMSTVAKRDEVALGYKGELKQGQRHGEGEMRYETGDFYRGQWADNKMHGYGQYCSANGNSYEGPWIHDNKHGSGSETFADGNRFSGQFENDKRVGNGKFTFFDGSFYEGEYQNNQRQGHGVYFDSSDRTSYSGQVLLCWFCFPVSTCLFCFASGWGTRNMAKANWLTRPVIAYTMGTGKMTRS
jgi:AMP deaminase